jgi:SAM-dependent methyltransferase
MSVWSEGYVIEIGYTHGYYRELSPHYLALAALARGLRAPGSGHAPLHVLELGCGQGFSANLIAAANPHIHYTAVDFNPVHIAGALALAAEASVSNVDFIEASFEDIVGDHKDDYFDIIALHGIYSWVSAENRAHILTIIRDCLKTGGFVYLSYNCYPGWTPVLPIRRMMRDAAGSDFPIADQLDTAFRLFDQMKEIGARYLATPGLAERVDKFKTMPRNYLAHEFMNADWSIFHFADVAADMASAKLTFAGSAHVLDLLDILNFSPEQMAFLASIKDPVRRESLRDLIVNQQFRRDIFGRGLLPLSVSESRARWLDQRLALSMEASKIPRKLASLRGELELQPEVYDALLGKLDGGPKTLRELASDPAIAALGWQRLLQATTLLVGQGHCHPALPEAGEAARVKRTDAFNGAVLARARDSADLTFLASPVTGGGIQADRLTQLYLLAVRDKAPDRYRFVWEVLKAQGQKIVKDGTTLETDADNLAEVTDKLKAFEAGPARVLATLKVR